MLYVCHICVKWPNVWNMCPHTVVRNGSTHCEIATTLAWCAKCSLFSTDIVATSSAFGQIEQSLIYKYKNVGCFSSSQVHYSLHCNTEKKIYGQFKLKKFKKLAKANEKYRKRDMTGETVSIDMVRFHSESIWSELHCNLFDFIRLTCYSACC